jgi:hypothetical protein
MSRSKASGGVTDTNQSPASGPLHAAVDICDSLRRKEQHAWATAVRDGPSVERHGRREGPGGPREPLDGLSSSLRGGPQPRLGGMRAPMIQKSGMKMPMMNITQWPLRIEMIPRVTSSTK